VRAGYKLASVWLKEIGGLCIGFQSILISSLRNLEQNRKSKIQCYGIPCFIASSFGNPYQRWHHTQPNPIAVVAANEIQGKSQQKKVWVNILYLSFNLTSFSIYFVNGPKMIPVRSKTIYVTAY
jgi:hypothetical protein